MKDSFKNKLLKDATYKERASYLEFSFLDLGKVHPSTVQRICNKELNYTYKSATDVADGANSKSTLMKRKIVLYLFAELNL